MKDILCIVFNPVFIIPSITEHTWKGLQHIVSRVFDYYTYIKTRLGIILNLIQ